MAKYYGKILLAINLFRIIGSLSRTFEKPRLKMYRYEMVDMKVTEI